MNKAACLALLLALYLPSQGQVYSLPSEYDRSLPDLCLQAQGEWHLDMNMAERNLAQIYLLLNLSGSHIDIITCNQLGTSAMAYLDPSDGKRYILINESKLTDINEKYYSHMFVIAHEVGHLQLGHFTSTTVPTLENKRKMELEADQFGASVVKKAGGTIDDCIYALDLMHHPTDEMEPYSDHPTKEKRIQAVRDGFGDDVDIKPAEHTGFRNVLYGRDDAALLKYNDDYNKYDIPYFYNKYGLCPVSILYFQDAFWIYYEKRSSVSNFEVLWSYDQYPGEMVQSYFDKGYNIESMEKINDKWYMVLLKYDKPFYQMTRTISKSDFVNKTGEYQEKVQKILDQGYSIQNFMEWNSDYFMILYTQYGSKGLYAWGLWNTYADFEDWYKQKAGEGYNYMYCYKILNNQFFGFMQKRENVSTWKIFGFDGSNDQDLLTDVNNGYYIDNITYGSGTVYFTLAK